MSLNESFLQLWEEEILGMEHPAVGDGASREHRKRYLFPYAETVIDGIEYKGRSRMVLGGMDTPTRIMSTNFDIIAAIEATEFTLNQWEYMSTRNRLFYCPFNLMIADVNPAHEFHWLNLRAEEAYTIPSDLIGKVPFPVEGMKRMQRICTRLEDNPKYYDPVRDDWTAEGVMYRLRLEQQTGVNYERFVKSIWATATDQVWANFRRATHIVQGECVEVDGYWRIRPGEEFPTFKERGVSHFVIGADWGWHPDPGVMQLWAVDKFGGAWLVKERYECKVSLDEWAEQAAEWQETYDVRVIVCDPSEPGNIAKINDRIGGRGGRMGSPLAVKANNAIMAGCDQVRWGFDDDERGEPRVRILDTATTVHCEHRALAKKPISWAQEIGGYVYTKQVDGKVYKERPDPVCEDHGCDTARYTLMHVWDNRYSAPMAPPEVVRVLDINLEQELAELHSRQRREDRQRRKRRR
jgi:phage terminase large subunit